MTKEEIEKAVEIIQAYIDGEKLESYIDGKWYERNDAINIEHYEIHDLVKYVRVKQKPQLTKEQIINNPLWHRKKCYMFKIISSDGTRYHWEDPFCIKEQAQIEYLQTICDLYKGQDNEIHESETN